MSKLLQLYCWEKSFILLIISLIYKYRLTGGWALLSSQGLSNNSLI